jgi:lycopene beta-cyclase
MDQTGQAQDLSVDYLLVGGGLQSALLATAIRHCKPSATVAILERRSEICGNHRWSFHVSDIPEPARCWFDGIPQRRWPGYHVRFPDFTRWVDSSYGSIRSQDFAAFLAQQDPAFLTIRHGVAVSAVSHDHALTDEGHRWQAGLVVDCRGLGSHCSQTCGYQKFFGFQFELLDNTWPDTDPTLMDSRVGQEDGYAFVYVLPFSSTSVLIEVTHFSDHAQLERQVCLEMAKRYMQRQGIFSASLVGEESGCLPMPYRSSNSSSSTQALIGGYRGGWFHPATGYSIPLAVRFAQVIATTDPDISSESISRLSRQMRPRRVFSYLLNRMLFRLVAPSSRYEIFRRIYRRLPVDSIERFYAHRFGFMDAARIFVGLPPRRLTPIRFIKSFEAK